MIFEWILKHEMSMQLMLDSVYEMWLHFDFYPFPGKMVGLYHKLLYGLYLGLGEYVNKVANERS